jgi:DNA-binding response OmpR family regulator
VIVVTLSPNNSEPRRALLVVADPAIRQVCWDVLGKAGFAVANGINSGAAAVTTAREQQPDVILLGQQLSDVPATEAVKWLRANAALATTPIIILGGNNDRAGTTTRGRVTVLSRPISAPQILDALNEALSGATTRRVM